MKIGKWKRRLLKLILLEVSAAVLVCLVLATGCGVPTMRWPFSLYPRYSDLELHGKVGRTCMLVGDVVGVAADIVCLPATLALDACFVVAGVGGEAALGLLFVPFIPGNLIATGAYYAGAGLTYPMYLAAVKLPRAIRRKAASDEAATTYLISRLPRVSASEYAKLVSASGRSVHVPPAGEATGLRREDVLQFSFGSRPFQFLACVPEPSWRLEGTGDLLVDEQGWPAQGRQIFIRGQPVGVFGYVTDEWKAWDKAGRPRGGLDEAAHVLDFWIMTHDMPECLGTDKLEQLLKVSEATVSKHFRESLGTGSMWRFWIQDHGGVREALALTSEVTAPLAIEEGFLARGEQRTWVFKTSPGRRILLSLEARIELRTSMGSSRVMQLTVNGRSVEPQMLVNKPPTYTLKDGGVFEYGAFVEGQPVTAWHLFVSDGYDPTHARPWTFERAPYIYVFDISSLADPGMENTITLSNVAPRSSSEVLAFRRVGILERDLAGRDTRQSGQWPFGDEEARRRQRQAAEELGVPVETSLDLGGGVTMKFMLIPAGGFMMGDDDSRPPEGEKPVHGVLIARPFYMGPTEVTQEQWKAVMGTEPWWGRSGNSKWGLPTSEAGPANHISWDDAQEFCRRLAEKAGCEVRLPTEAEWEYACRAGSDAAYCFGSSWKGLDEYAWYRRSIPEERAQPVAQKKPNAWGLYDMHGNVEEWCHDLFDSDYYRRSPRENPTGPDEGFFERVLRGGCWTSVAEDCRSGHRHKDYPKSNKVMGPYVGFRVVLSDVSRTQARTSAQ